MARAGFYDFDTFYTNQLKCWCSKCNNSKLDRWKQHCKFTVQKITNYKKRTIWW